MKKRNSNNLIDQLFREKYFIVGGGRVIGLRFAVFGHFLCGYLRFRGFCAIFLRFCGFGKKAAVLRFLAIFTCGLRY